MGLRGMRKGTKVIRWTAEEVDQVCMRAVELLRNGTGYTKKNALREAQNNCIAEERRKKIFGTQLVLRMYKKIDEFGAVPFKPVENPDLSKAVSAAASAAEAATKAAEVLTGTNPLIEFLKPLIAEFADSFARASAPILAKAIQDSVSRIVVTADAKPIAAPAEVPLTAAEEAAARQAHLPQKFHKHKIAIIGLLGSQQAVIKQRFPHLEIRFLDGTANKAKVESVTATCEAVFPMIKFVRHVTWHGTQGGCARVDVNGGVSELARLIESRFPRTTSMLTTEQAARQ